MLFSVLISTHVILTTFGYVGLIASNVWLLLLCREERAEMLVRAIGVWRRLARVFGPLLGIGALLGFWLAGVTHAPFAARWLLASYGWVFVALVTQAAIMVPWQLRVDAAIAQGRGISTRPIVVAVSLFTFAYASNMALMLLRPT